MSEIVHYRGKLFKNPKLEGESLEDQCKRLLSADKKPSFYDTYAEMLVLEKYKEFVIYNDVVYQVTNMLDVDLDEDFYVAEGSDGEYSFDVKYYNGGCSFDEAIKIALDKIN